MSAVTRYLLYLILLLLAGFAIYAAIAELPPPTHPITLTPPPPDS